MTSRRRHLQDLQIQHVRFELLKPNPIWASAGLSRIVPRASVQKATPGLNLRSFHGTNQWVWAQKPSAERHRLCRLREEVVLPGDDRFTGSLLSSRRLPYQLESSNESLGQLSSYAASPFKEPHRSSIGSPSRDTAPLIRSGCGSSLDF